MFDPEYKTLRLKDCRLNLWMPCAGSWGLKISSYRPSPSPGQACAPLLMGNRGAVPSVLRGGGEEQLDKRTAQPTRRPNHTGTKQHLGRRELVHSDMVLLFVWLFKTRIL